MIKEIRFQNELFAMIIPNSHQAKGVEFYTPNDYSQQLAAMGHPAGKEIAPHIHNIVQREVLFTQEVLILKKGRLRVDFYLKDKSYAGSTEIGAGDIILLVQGGHGFKVLEDIEMVEVKQGPYLGELDKERFDPILDDQVEFLEK